MAATFQLDYDDACLVIGVNAQPVAGCGELTGYRDSMCGLVALLANHSGDDSVDGRIACQFLNFARMICSFDNNGTVRYRYVHGS